MGHNTGKQQNSSKKNSNINHPSLKNKRFFLLPPCTGPLDGKMENTAYGGPTVPLMSKEQMFLNQRFAQPKKKKSKTTKVNDPIQHQSSQNYLSSSSTFLPPKNNNRWLFSSKIVSVSALPWGILVLQQWGNKKQTEQHQTMSLQAEKKARTFLHKLFLQKLFCFTCGLLPSLPAPMFWTPSPPCFELRRVRPLCIPTFARCCCTRTCCCWLFHGRYRGRRKWKFSNLGLPIIWNPKKDWTKKRCESNNNKRFVCSKIIVVLLSIKVETPPQLQQEGMGTWVHCAPKTIIGCFVEHRQRKQ